MRTQDIEQEIQRILATETSAVALSEKIFSPDGLFAKLASTYEERKALIHSALYQSALERFHELQSSEMEAFRQAVASLQGSEFAKHCAVKIEPSNTAAINAVDLPR